MDPGNVNWLVDDTATLVPGVFRQQRIKHGRSNDKVARS
jgi:hypothetical protein